MELKQPQLVPHSNFLVYYAGARTNYAEDFLTVNNYCRLMSYVNEKRQIEKLCKINRPVFVDSGAFSAVTRGIEINVDDYIDWLNTWSKPMEQFCCFDRIGLVETEFEECAKATWENYLYMYERVNEPDKLVYVYHYGEPIEYLKRAIEFGCKRIALGGIAKRSYLERKEFFDSVQDIFTEHSDIRVHAFGVTDLKSLQGYDFIRSADSTTWIWPQKFSQIETSQGRIFMAERNKNEKKYIYNLPQDKYDSLILELAKYEFVLDDVLGADPIAVKNRDVWMIIFWQDRFLPLRGGVLKRNEYILEE